MTINERLIQFQCGKEGTLFYYQSSMINPPYFIEHCPVCGSKRITPTGREYPAVDENSRLPKDAADRAMDAQEGF